MQGGWRTSQRWETTDLSGVAPGGGRRFVAYLPTVCARMAFKRLEMDREGKVGIGRRATFKGIYDTFKRSAAGPSDTGTLARSQPYWV